MNMDEAAKHLYDSIKFQTLVPNLHKSLEKNHFQAQGLFFGDSIKKKHGFSWKNVFEASRPNQRLVSSRLRSSTLQVRIIRSLGGSDGRGDFVGENPMENLAVRFAD